MVYYSKTSSVSRSEGKNRMSKRKYPGITPAGAGRWHVTVRLNAAGKIVARQKTIGGTLEQARDLFARMKAEIRQGDAGRSLTSPAKNFGEILSTYREIRNKTSPQDISRCDKLTSELGDISVDQFADRFEKYMRIFRNTPTKKTGKLPKNGTVNRDLEIVRAAFALAVQLGKIETSPITKYRFPKLKEIPRDRALTDLDRQRLLNTIDREAGHLSYAVRFLLTVPTRKSEIVGMLRGDLDLINGAIRVRNGTTKNDRGCWKPIPPDLETYFRTLPAETDYLFYRRDSKGVCKPLGDFRKAWRRCLRLAGINDFRIHDTRHEAATALVDNGTPEQVVMSVAGWKTNMLRTYYHIEPKKTLELVRFAPHYEGVMKGSEIKTA